MSTRTGQDARGSQYLRNSGTSTLKTNLLGRETSVVRCGVSVVAHTHTHKRQLVEVTALPNPLSGILCKRLLGRLTQQGPRMGGLVKRWSVAIDFFACGAPDVRRAVRSDSSCRRVRDVPPLGIRDNGKKSSLAAEGKVYGGPRLLGEAPGVPGKTGSGRTIVMRGATRSSGRAHQNYPTRGNHAGH